MIHPLLRVLPIVFHGLCTGRRWHTGICSTKLGLAESREDSSIDGLVLFLVKIRAVSFTLATSCLCHQSLLVVKMIGLWRRVL